MGKYDLALSDAKRRVTSELVRVNMPGGDLSNLASAIDDLNAAWDKLTDCLVRQREERDAQIVRLIDELAERPE